MLCMPRMTNKKGVRDDTFDFVVVGGGSGAARRKPLSRIPHIGGALEPAARTTTGVTTPRADPDGLGKVNKWAFDTVRRPAQWPHRLPAARQGLGGSSAITPWSISAAPRDYDQWAALGIRLSMPSVPNFKRSEDNSELGASITARRPLMSRTALRQSGAGDLLQAAREAQSASRGFQRREQEGLGTYQVTQKNGERWSAARGYIHPSWLPAPTCASRPRRTTRSCSRAARVASNTGRAEPANSRPPRSDPRLRRVPDPHC